MSGGEYPAGGVALALSGETMHMVWRERQPDQDCILHVSLTQGDWMATEAASPPLNRGGAPALAATSDGYLHCLWDYAELLEHCHRSDQLGQWDAVELAAMENYRLRAVALAADPGSRIHTVWGVAKAGDVNELQYATREPAMSHRIFLPRLWVPDPSRFGGRAFGVVRRDIGREEKPHVGKRKPEGSFVPFGFDLTSR